MPLGTPANALLSLAFLHIGIHIHLHHFHGPAVDYGALAVAAFASWVGVPGPGEPVLIAAAVLAAKHNLGIVSVLAVAFLAATAGGIVGWLIGMRAGRGLLTAPGPRRKLRIKAVDRGEEVFERYAVLAVILTPSWIAGIHRVRTPVYMFANALGSAIWAGGIGISAYLIGPSVVDAVEDAGAVTTAILGVAIVAIVIAALLRHRRKSAPTEAAPPNP
jgi:membrane protein DedA with SNARE-associated domain